MRKYLLVIISLLMFTLTASAKVWSADEVPMVHLQDKNQYVCDPENLLTQACRDSANNYLRLLENKCKVQSVFVVVGNIENADAYRFCQDIGMRYGVGDKKTNKGLVIVIAVDDHKYFIAPGRGLEADITDIVSGRIGRRCIRDNMKRGQLDDAVVETSKAIFLKLDTGSSGIEGGDEDEERSDEEWVLLIFLLICVFGAPLAALIIWLLEVFGLKKPTPKSKRRRHDDDDWMPPFIFGGGGGGSFGGGSFGGSFGGGSFGGGGAGGGW